jgi:hypothetical protein
MHVSTMDAASVFLCWTLHVGHNRMVALFFQRQDISAGTKWVEHVGRLSMEVVLWGHQRQRSRSKLCATFWFQNPGASPGLVLRLGA